jgi:tRNA(Ile)-lysidine synthase
LKKSIWQPFEHQLYHQLKNLSGLIVDKTLTLMVSGGADSLALLVSFSRLKGRFSPPLKIDVVHFNHGVDGVSDQVRLFRMQSESFVVDRAEKLGLEVQVLRNIEAGDMSEEEARNFRLNQVQNMVIENPNRIFAWGHHRDDLLETRFMRLMRGTGLQGLEAMKSFKAPHFRPWLNVSRTEIEEYLKSLSETWMRDPDRKNLRSWLRDELFPQLESRQKGSLGALARSLEQLVSAQNQEIEQDNEIFLADGSLSHPRFQCLGFDQQKQTLALYLYSLGRRDYTRGQIHEILKRLDKAEIRHTFNQMGLDWHVNAEQIRAQPALK